MSTPSPWAHFSMEELTCKCGCGQMKMDDGFMKKMVKIRELYNKSLTVTSGYRCPAHNSDPSVAHTGAEGPHTTGRAIDIAISGAEAYGLLKAAMMVGGVYGFGLNQIGDHSKRFVHIDDLTAQDKKSDGTPNPRPGVWTY